MTCGLRDAEGFWWYGGKGTGLCRFDGYETEVFRSDRQNPHLLRSNDVLCMTEQSANAEIWFGTKEGGYILSKKDYTVRPIVVNDREDNELVVKRIACMVTSADGSVWLTYRNQLLHLSAKAELMERFETTWEGRNRSVSHLYFDADSTLWADLWNGGVICLKRENERWRMDERRWSSFPENQRHEMTDEEIKHILDSVMTQQAPRNDATMLSWASLPLPKEPHHFFYIGTYHSLYLYDGQLLKPLQGDLDKVRSMAYSEKLQSLFLLSKTRGVCRWKDEKLTVLLDSVQFRQLQLQGDTALLLTEGVGSFRMLNLRTLCMTADTTTADVLPIVTAYTLDGKKQLMAFGQQTLSLPRGTNLVEICLSTLDFDHAAQVQFAYRLNDDGTWTELREGEHMVKFTHLPSGESHLHVRGTDAYGRWSAPATVLVLMRPRAWYEYKWLWVLLGVFVLCGGFYLRSRIRTTGTMEEKGAPEGTESSEDELSKLSVADKEFLDKAVAAVSAHITDSSYSVDTLASDLCMSRANLHRKMRAITGRTPTDFIRNQRLERAAHLLRTTSHSVNEIADLVGFSYASYFTKCFKEKYGVLPKDY